MDPTHLLIHCYIARFARFVVVCIDRCVRIILTKVVLAIVFDFRHFDELFIDDSRTLVDNIHCKAAKRPIMVAIKIRYEGLRPS